MHTPDDVSDAVTAAVLARHPHLTGDALARKVRLATALKRYTHDGPTWTAGRSRGAR